MLKKAPEEPKPLSFATPNPWSALPREVYVGKGRGKKEGATTESPVDGQDQPKIYTIRDHTEAFGGRATSKPPLACATPNPRNPRLELEFGYLQSFLESLPRP